MFLRKEKYSIKFNNSGYTNDEVKEVLNYCHKEFIEKLIFNLQEWLRIQYNPDLSFNGELLDRFGFTNCKKCYSHFLPFKEEDIFSHIHKLGDLSFGNMVVVNQDDYIFQVDIDLSQKDIDF